MKVIKKEIDWSKGGQLVMYNDTYVVTSGNHGDEGFSCTDLSNGEPTDVWNKESFTLVEGPVTFEND